MLECRFPATGFFICSKGFRICERHRPADLCVVRASLGSIVLVQSFLKVVRATGVQSAVSAFEDVCVEHVLTLLPLVDPANRAARLPFPQDRHYSLSMFRADDQRRVQCHCHQDPLDK